MSARARSCVSACTVVPAAAPVFVRLYYCARQKPEALERSAAMRSCMRQYLYFCTVVRLHQRMRQYLYCGARQPEELERSDALLHAAFHIGCEAHKNGGVEERLAHRVRDAVDRLDEVGEDNALAGALARRARAEGACSGAALSLRGAVPDATRDDGAPPRLRAAECVSICTFVLVNASVLFTSLTGSLLKKPSVRRRVKRMATFVLTDSIQAWIHFP